MACNCSAPCNCPTVSVAPAIIAEPGPPSEVTAGVTIVAAGTPAQVLVSGVPPLQNLQFLLPAAPSPVFNTDVPVTALPAGSTPSASIDNSNPLIPQLSLELVAGADGADGTSPFTALSASFVQPAAGSTVTVTGADVSWMSLDGWVYISGGGHYVVASNPLSATQILVRNPGAADLAPFGWSATSVPTNAAPGATITPSGYPTQVEASGPPGVSGEVGGDADPLVVSITTSVPVSPPASPEDYLVLYQDVAPPGTPTVMRFYSWDGATWQASSNMVGAAGAQTFFGSADPNVTPPSGSNIGDSYWRTQGTTLTYYQRTGVSTWTVQGTFSLLGTTTITDTHSVAGTYTFDAAYFSYIIDASADIDLDIDTTNYDGQGMWVFNIYNSDGSSIDLSVGGCAESGIPTLPLTIPTTETAIVVLRRWASGAATFSTKPIIEQAYLVV